MKQVLQHARTGEITVADVPAPQLLPGCVLVRIAASVVSAGTERASAEFARKSLVEKARSRPDLVREVIGKVRRDGIYSAIQAVSSRLDQPQSPGYSSAGTVLAVGEGVTDLQPGDRVACAGAGFAVHAEIACVPRLLVARIPARALGVSGSGTDEVPFDEAAFATLGAVALHGIRNAEAKLGDLVAVIGLGLLGQLTVQLLKAAGCRVLGIDLDLVRADLAQRMGADCATSSATSFRDLCGETSRGVGVDSVLITAETSSSDPVNLAGAVARDRDRGRRRYRWHGHRAQSLLRKRARLPRLAFLRSGPSRRGLRAERARLSHRLRALDRNPQHGSVRPVARREESRCGCTDHAPLLHRARRDCLQLDYREIA